MHIIGNGKMPCDAHGPGNLTAAPYPHAARDTGAGRNGGVRAYMHVVSDLNQVVELYAVINNRVIDGAPVDGGIGAYLHVVTNEHATDLRHFYPYPFLMRDTEAIRADDNPGVNNASPAYPAIVINRYIWKNTCTAADGNIIANAAIRTNNYTVTETDIFAQHDIRPHTNLRTQRRGCRHGGAGMHANCNSRYRIQERRNAGKISIGIAANNARDRRDILVSWRQDDGAGMGSKQLMQKTLAGYKRNGINSRVFERAYPRYRYTGIPGDLAAERLH